MAKRRGVTLAAGRPSKARPERFACRRCAEPVVSAELSADGKRSSVRLCDWCRTGVGRMG